MSDPSSRRQGRAMLIGVAIGLSAGLMVTLAVGYVMYRRANFTGGSGQTVPAVVAATDLPAGTALAFDQLTTRPIPESLATPSVVRTEAMNEVLGARTRIELRAGDLIYRGAVEPGAGTPGFPP